MQQWEKSKEGEPPKVKPMKVNWKNFDGPWNSHLCELFVKYCASQGLDGGNPSDEMQEFVASYFWERLARLRTIVKKGRPKGDETSEQTSVRTQEQHLQALSVARRNSRRHCPGRPPGPGVGRCTGPCGNGSWSLPSRCTIDRGGLPTQNVLLGQGLGIR